ncbi:bombesin receptor subtype-3-like [Acanthaster planci]|uniref:Bombesin receptor subtype-3-like n=1 Tax=Acanthaster planci TaxID=133434 RepID=A0A8B7Y6Q1_ACAPL|nr:bombesin receptor subtype-3-like [Acanthaster planci]XP_022088893.1 bombesin receptor subtype-3-like [Acanthaster planci]XP_022088894.1 bombesin receptor subtype-3-like [Acanthaster planci]XP_022088895.1 bombesin receptor subtype-3-like [Acanthaster planci]XP_022088896.1 bombesin receptor subtype-3-like [Acanthaster planci]XP_022088897.1 bombesin receptor subtype-3-like [Acanthaster planci]
MDNYLAQEMEFSYLYSENDTCVDSSCLEARSLAGPIGVALLSLIGLVGNLSIIYLVVRHKKLRNPPNILIINLTVGDLLYILSASTFFIEKEISPSWEAAVSTCKLKAYVEDVGQSMCVFSLAALSRERYLAIVCGIENRRRRGSCSVNSLCAVAVVISTSLLLGIPSLVFASKTNYKQCNQFPTHEIVKKVFVSLRSVLGYVLPLAIVSFFYIRIASSLYKSVVQFDYTESHAQQSRLRKRLAGIVLFITVLFAIFWLPHFIHLHVRAYTSVELIALLPYPSYIDYLRIISFLMALTNSCTNPWIVFVMSSTYRQRCCLFRCVWSRQRLRHGQGTMRLTTLTGTTRRTSANVSQMSHV